MYYDLTIEMPLKQFDVNLIDSPFRQRIFSKFLYNITYSGVKNRKGTMVLTFTREVDLNKKIYALMSIAEQHNISIKCTVSKNSTAYNRDLTQRRKWRQEEYARIEQTRRDLGLI